TTAAELVAFEALSPKQIFNGTIALGLRCLATLPSLFLLQGLRPILVLGLARIWTCNGRRHLWIGWSGAHSQTSRMCSRSQCMPALATYLAFLTAVLVMQVTGQTWRW